MTVQSGVAGSEGGTDVNTIPLERSMVDYSDGPETDIVGTRTGAWETERMFRRIDVYAQSPAREGH